MALTQPSRDGPTPAAAGSNPRLRSHRTLHPSAAVFHRPTALCKHPDAFLFVTAFDSILIIVQQNLPTCQEEGNRDFSVEIKAVRWYSIGNRILMQLLHRPRGGRGKGQEPTSRSPGGSPEREIGRERGSRCVFSAKTGKHGDPYSHMSTALGRGFSMLSHSGFVRSEAGCKRPEPCCWQASGLFCLDGFVNIHSWRNQQ